MQVRLEARQAHFPPVPCHPAWHCDITDVMSPHRAPQARCNHLTGHRFSPNVTEHHGTTQTHFPPKPCHTAWHRDIRDAISPHRIPLLNLDLPRTYFRHHIYTAEPQARSYFQRYICRILESCQLFPPQSRFNPPSPPQVNASKSPKRALRSRLPPLRKGLL